MVRPKSAGEGGRISIEGPAFDREGNLYVVDTPFGRIPDEAQRKQVLVDNPARLYGFR